MCTQYEHQYNNSIISIIITCPTVSYQIIKKLRTTAQLQDDNISDINYSTAELTTVKKHHIQFKIIQQSHRLRENDENTSDCVRIQLDEACFPLKWHF